MSPTSHRIVVEMRKKNQIFSLACQKRLIFRFSMIEQKLRNVERKSERERMEKLFHRLPNNRVEAAAAAAQVATTETFHIFCIRWGRKIDGKHREGERSSGKSFKTFFLLFYGADKIWYQKATVMSGNDFFEQKVYVHVDKNNIIIMCT